MKAVFISVFCLVALIVCIEGDTNRNKRWLLDRCSADGDCGADRCCVRYLKICASKRGLNQSCNLVNLHGCGCKDGLECRVYKSLGSLKYYRCLESEGSGDM
ncbi:uncharacterized protein LOC116296196 [Actinia tenebrosa]|uniref:Uncharacterized protein LOC116296196 n=1 Tax=Actinia tenebrosa TaxID=6105 RepID=A0A6P8HXH3_ACTTE|nr:uncharacterized protein LOC116296196 [Actinia tenebrosa]